MPVPLLSRQAAASRLTLTSWTWRVPPWAELLLALLPAILLVVLSIALNHFALIDDGVILAGTRGGFLDNFRIGDSGRFFPLYQAYHWVLVRVLPAQPWAFSLGNGVFLLIAAWQVQRLAHRLGGPPAGVAAAWLFTLNLSTVENIFTLGKAEPKQLVFWLATLALMQHTSAGLEDRLTRFQAPLMLLCTTATVLSKETGILLLAPLSVLALNTMVGWRTLAARDRHRRVWLIMASMTPLAGSAVMTFLHGLRAGSYGRAVVMGRRFSSYLLPPELFRTDATLGVLLIAGLALRGD